MEYTLKQFGHSLDRYQICAPIGVSNVKMARLLAADRVLDTNDLKVRGASEGLEVTFEMRDSKSAPTAKAIMEKVTEAANHCEDWVKKAFDVKRVLGAVEKYNTNRR